MVRRWARSTYIYRSRNAGKVSGTDAMITPDNYEDRIVTTNEHLQALCLREVPTVDNWKKTRMSKHVVRHVVNGWYPAELCSIIKEEYPEWFL